MAFDIDLAIAALDAKGLSYADDMDYSVLREKYPELGFLFDKLETVDVDERDLLRDEAETYEAQAYEEAIKKDDLLDTMTLVRDQLIRAQGLMEGGGAEYLIADAVAKLDVEITSKGDNSG